MVKKIIVCAPLPPPYGGIVNWYKILASQCKKHGYEIININTSPRKTIDGRTIFYRVFVQGFRMLAQRRELGKIIKTNDVSAVHITTSGYFALVRDILFMKRLKKKKKRSIYHIHFGRIPEIFARKGLEYHLLKRAISLATEVIVIDPKTYDVLSKEYSTVVHYIPNPVDEVSIDDCKSSSTLLFLGNVLKTKGIDELLQAWENITDRYSDWSLTIAGFCENEYKEYIEKHFSLKNVNFTGAVKHEDAIEMIKNSSFLVLPSYTEGFPNVVIEAMMCAKAVVATDVGAIADILDGNCGLVIQPQSVEELQNAMNKMIENPDMRLQMGSAGREKALKQYASNVVFEQYSELWRGTNE